MDSSGEFKKIEERHLSDLFSEAGESRLLVISKERAELYNLLDLGEYGVQAVRAGETEFVMRTPYNTPVIDKAYHISLDDDLDKSGSQGPEEKHVSSSYTDNAREIAELRTDTEEKLTCMNCRGEAYFTTDCSCAIGGIVFSDDESGEVSQLRKDGVPDGNCKTCKGSGEVTNACGSCQGTGYNYKYPILTITNNETGNSTTELLDVAQLIATGRLPLYTSYEGKMVTAKMSELIKSMAVKVGINPKQLIGVGEYGGYELADAWSEISVQPEGYSRQWNTQQKPALMTQQEIIEVMQNQVARTYNHKWQSVLDELGVARGREYKVAEAPTSTFLLKELVEIIEASGHRLGYQPSFFETGMAGPSFFVLNHDMQTVTQLSVEDSLPLAIFNAHKTAKQHLS